MPEIPNPTNQPQLSTPQPFTLISHKEKKMNKRFWTIFAVLVVLSTVVAACATAPPPAAPAEPAATSAPEAAAEEPSAEPVNLVMWWTGWQRG